MPRPLPPLQPLEVQLRHPPAVEAHIGARPRRMAATMHRCRGWGKSGLAAESFAVPFTEQGVVCPLATQMAHSVSEAHSDKGADNR